MSRTVGFKWDKHEVTHQLVYCVKATAIYSSLSECEDDFRRAQADDGAGAGNRLIEAVFRVAAHYQEVMVTLFESKRDRGVHGAPSFQEWFDDLCRQETELAHAADDVRRVWNDSSRGGMHFMAATIRDKLAFHWDPDVFEEGLHQLQGDGLPYHLVLENTGTADKPALRAPLAYEARGAYLSSQMGSWQQIRDTFQALVEPLQRLVLYLANAAAQHTPGVRQHDRSVEPLDR